MSSALDSIRTRFGTVSDKYLKEIFHDKFDPKNIIRLSHPLERHMTMMTLPNLI
jgi:hypothetical protein